MQEKLIDHLFRHHYGKMVSVLTRIFGLAHLDTIEDAIQDTFLKAAQAWKIKQPEYPEAWLTKAAKNRVLDIFRKLKAEKARIEKSGQGIEAIALNELFLDDEIADSQLRMIFAACHPSLDPKDRIAFALKTVSGFSQKEIAAALLTKEDTIKKRLTRARKIIQEGDIPFNIPQGKELPNRLDNVLEVLYLIFNEGFHSNKQELLVRKELCAEAMRLCNMLLKQKHTKTPASHALFALMCFHAARIDAKTSSDNALIDLEHQDRSLWFVPLISMGNVAMTHAVDTPPYSTYHYEAAIIAEHLKANTFKQTDWDAILKWYKELYALQPWPIHLLSMAIAELYCNRFRESEQLLNQISVKDLGQRDYLYYATYADFYYRQEAFTKSIESLDKAIAAVTNDLEKEYLEKKRMMILTS